MASFESGMRKRQAVKDAEAAGIVADSMEVRKALMAKVATGELTLSQAQAEIAKIKRESKRSGKMTRAQAFSRG